MRETLVKPELQYKEVDPSTLVVKKEVVSAKTKKPLKGKKLGKGRKIAFRYTYADGSVFESKFHKPSKPEIAVFKAQPVAKEKGELGFSHIHDPRELEPEENRTVQIFRRCLDIAKGGPVKNVRQAVAKLLGGFQIPNVGKFEILINWKVFEDFDKTFLLDAPPSKRFTVDAVALYAGYKKFLQSIKDMKNEDFEDDTGLTQEDAKENFPAVWKAWQKSLKEGFQIPANVTRAFIEKQILALAQGRGIYISDQSYFRDWHGKKKGKKDRTEKPSTATMSELCVIVWRLPVAKKKRKPKTKAKAKSSKKKRGKR